MCDGCRATTTYVQETPKCYHVYCSSTDALQSWFLTTKATFFFLCLAFCPSSDALRLSLMQQKRWPVGLNDERETPAAVADETSVWGDSFATDTCCMLMDV